MLKVLANLLLLASIAYARIKYDQSQTGDYNVHLDLKNIEIVAILDDSSFSNNEYDYDYGEMTLKPSSNATDSSNDTVIIKPSGEHNHSTTATISSTTDTASIFLPASDSTKPKRRCGAGFFRDVNGRCRRQRKPNMKLDELLHQAKTMFGRKNNS